tara:strand:+ start:7067 stop:7939 length:873 start_codon:yes stop_codon:yes gene_type:complete
MTDTMNQDNLDVEVDGTHSEWKEYFVLQIGCGAEYSSKRQEGKIPITVLEKAIADGKRSAKETVDVLSDFSKRYFSSARVKIRKDQILSELEDEAFSPAVDIYAGGYGLTNAHVDKIKQFAIVYLAKSYKNIVSKEYQDSLPDWADALAEQLTLKHRQEASHIQTALAYSVEADAPLIALGKMAFEASPEPPGPEHDFVIESSILALSKVPPVITILKLDDRGRLKPTQIPFKAEEHFYTLYRAFSTEDLYKVVIKSSVNPYEKKRQFEFKRLERGSDLVSKAQAPSEEG